MPPIHETPIRLIVWGICQPENAGAIRFLKRQTTVDLIAWFGIAKDCTHEIFNFFNFSQDYDFRSQAVNEALYNYVYQDLSIFMDMYSRHNRDAKRRPVKLYDYHDYIHAFNRYLYFFSDMLLKNRVNLVLFDANPHDSPDFILYKICKFWGIHTVILSQSLFPNRYMYMMQLGDYKRYYSNETSPRNPQLEKVQLEKQEKLFYMSNLKHPQFELKELWLVLSKDFFKKLKRKQFESFLEQIPYLVKYLDYRQYRKNVLSMLQKNFQLNVPYVYFPLHYQPEMTTSALGGVYVDQLLALERLAKLIPKDWLIYTKEHIIQTEFMRGNWFFQRLKQINNVRLLPIETNTFELIENAQFVSTVTGTAGWEALKHGKKTLIFGSVWYEGMPGAFSYKENFDWPAFMNYTIDITELENAVNNFVSRMETGVIESVTACLVKDFDPDKNGIQVGQFLLTLFQGLLNQSQASLSNRSETRQ